MPTLYDDLMFGVKDHFYRMQSQSPSNRDAIKIETIIAPYGVTPLLSVRKVIYDGDKYILEEKRGIINFTDLKLMERILDGEEKKVISDLERIFSENKANLSEQESRYEDVHPLGLGMNDPSINPSFSKKH